MNLNKLKYDHYYALRNFSMRGVGWYLGSPPLTLVESGRVPSVLELLNEYVFSIILCHDSTAPRTPDYTLTHVVAKTF